MSAEQDNRTKQPGAVELGEEELGDVFGGRMLRIASFYLRDHIKARIDVDHQSDVTVNPDK